MSVHPMLLPMDVDTGPAAQPVKKRYWATPPDMMKALNDEFAFDFDPCPHPRPEGFDGLSCEWGRSNWVNPPFTCGPTEPGKRKVGLMAWVKKSIEQQAQGKLVVMILPIYQVRAITALIAHGVELRNAGLPQWHALEDGTPNPAPPRDRQPCFLFILRPKPLIDPTVLSMAVALAGCPASPPPPALERYWGRGCLIPIVIGLVILLAMTYGSTAIATATCPPGALSRWFSPYRPRVDAAASTSDGSTKPSELPTPQPLFLPPYSPFEIDPPASCRQQPLFNHSFGTVIGTDPNKVKIFQ